SEPQRLIELAERVDRAARRLKTASSNGSGLSQGPATEPSKAAVTLAEPVQPVAKKETTSARQDLELEVRRLRSELEYRSRFTDSLQHFLEKISCADPVKTYNSIIASSKELLQSERASLMVLDEINNELVMKAASGLSAPPETVSPVRVGEGVSGEVIDTGKAVMVTDLRMAGRKPAPAERHYKTNSFISYPITISGRKVG